MHNNNYFVSFAFFTPKVAVGDTGVLAEIALMVERFADLAPRAGLGSIPGRGSSVCKDAFRFSVRPSPSKGPMGKTEALAVAREFMDGKSLFR